MPRIQLTQAARIVVCSLLSCCALSACDSKTSPESNTAAPAFEVHKYIVRGEIKHLPAEGAKNTDIEVHHEMIPDFRGQGGHIGMKAMVMPFPIDENLDLSPLSVGDIITLTFTVDFDAQEDKLLAYRATNIEPLPEGTDLVFLRLDTYTVRARVTSLPDPANPMSEFAVHHEYIPEFKGPGGKTGMNVMVMPFPLADGLSLDGLDPGDFIELTFSVDFDTKQDKPTAYRAIRWSPLPNNTQLNLSTAAPSE